MPGDSQELDPEILLLVLLGPKFFVDLFGYFFGSCIFRHLNAINGFFDAFGIIYEPVGGSSRFIKEKGSLNLVLSLLVSWRCSFMGNIPAMVVDVSSITPSIGGLGISLSVGGVLEPMPNQQVLMALRIVLVEVASNVFRVVRGWKRDTGIPFAGLCAKEIFVYLIQYNSFDCLCLRPHMCLSIKEGMLRRVVNLSILH